MKPFQIAVPLYAASAQHVGTGGGNQGVDGVLRIGGIAADGRHDAEEEDGNKSGFVVTVVCVFHLLYVLVVDYYDYKKSDIPEV
jgi:hypothetical protein